MFSVVLELFLLILSICLVFCENTIISSSRLASSSKGVTTNPVAFTGNKNVQFVNHIKDDLRRNNDDYADPPRINTTNPYLSIAKHSAHTIARTDATKADVKRDNFFDNKGKNDLTLDAKRKLFKSDSRRFELQPASPKDILKQNQKVATTQRSRSPVKSTPLRDILKKFTRREDYPKYVTPHRKESLSDSLMKKPPKDMLRDSRVKMRVSSNKEDNEEKEKKAWEATMIPPGEHLDMAPGKGGRIHAMRNKNSLCHRNVMVPEGPKYDKHGNVYLHAYQQILGHEYHQTRVPQFLLPRCCNCCKKSVLGCE